MPWRLVRTEKGGRNRTDPAGARTRTRMSVSPTPVVILHPAHDLTCDVCAPASMRNRVIVRCMDRMIWIEEAGAASCRGEREGPHNARVGMATSTYKRCIVFGTW